MLYREIIAVCSEIHIKTLCGQNVELYLKTQPVPRSKHTVSVIKTSQLMLYTEITLVGKHFFSLPVRIQGDSYSLDIAESEYNSRTVPPPTNFKGGGIIFNK
jgi:hypothetical protein